MVGYPRLPWWAMMALGWVFGQWIINEQGRGRSAGAFVRPILLSGLALLEATARALGMHEQEGLGVTVLAAVGALVVLHPPCRWYRAQKTCRPHSLLRYV
jgi:uncharacterized membrane protein